MDSTVSMSAIPTAVRCSYRSKPCNSIRATKVNGEFHKLCEYHRRRANLNQQRVHQRRKLRELDEQRYLYRNSVSVEEEEGRLHSTELEVECEPSPSPCGDLPLPDLKLLEMLLSDNHRDAPTASAPREFCQMDPMGV
ncbi:hypothetical protein Gpo141_00012980 [Globisporangium polare]